MIRDLWHATPTEPQPFARMFKSCEADMNAFISDGEEKRAPLRCTIEALVGGPSSVAEKAEWQRLFGLAVGGDIVDEVFVGEELEIDIWICYCEASDLHKSSSCVLHLMYKYVKYEF